MHIPQTFVETHQIALFGVGLLETRIQYAEPAVTLHRGNIA